MEELLAEAKLKENDIFVVGCSSSEVLGERIGKGSSPETAQAIFDEIYRWTAKWLPGWDALCADR